MTVHQFTVVIEPDEDAFHAYVPALPGCHTFGATVEESVSPCLYTKDARFLLGLYEPFCVMQTSALMSFKGSWKNVAELSSSDQLCVALS